MSIWLTEYAASTGKTIQDDSYLESVFEGTCSEGHLAVAQWLLDYAASIGYQFNIHEPSDLNGTPDVAFQNACIHGNIEIVSWLANYCISIQSPIKFDEFFH